jgi:ribonuclease Z
LVNGPFGDPGLYIPFGFQHRAIMFDLGDISALSSKDILKISHIFVTHTHMVHFAGFDRLLRLMIGRAKKLCIYGPRGFLKNVEGKLAGYTWNLVKNYSESLVLEIAEIHAHQVIRRQYTCMNQFNAREEPHIAPFNGRILEESDLTINAAILDHGIPCLGFAIEERFHINIRKNVLATLNLQPGPWLQIFKKSVYDNLDPATRIEAESTQKDKLIKFRLAELLEQIVLITPGQKVSYVADASYNEINIEKILSLVGNSDHLFIEAAFLDKHRDTAKHKNHLTARQAGLLAGRAQVKQITPFHFSPRYTECGHLLEAEARQAYTASFGAAVAPPT